MRLHLLEGVILLIFFGTLAVRSATALNEPTHDVINRQATRQSGLDQYLKDQLGFLRGIEESVQGREVVEWIGEGGIREDDGSRFFRHFHDPLQSWGNAGLADFDSSIHWMQQNNQGSSWQNAREYFHTALTATTRTDRENAFADTFRALGQVMHLVVDASVPEHVRNDPHAAEGLCRMIGIRCFGNYEYWVSDQHGVAGSQEENAFITGYLANPAGFDASILQQPTNDAAAPATVARLIDTDTYTGIGSGPNVTLNPAIGIGEFANANFFSEDSINGSYPFPNVNALVPSQVSPGSGKVFRYYAKAAGDGIPNDVAAAECVLDQAARDQGIFNGPTYFCTDQTVWSRAAQEMLPRAVGYARGVLDYFFRGRISAFAGDMGCSWPQLPPVFSSVEMVVSNDSPDDEESGAGELDFVVHYEVGGVKHFLPLVSQSVFLERDQVTRFQFSTAPLNSVPSNAVNVFMIVAYRGSLGQEINAVIGGQGFFFGLC